MGKRGNDNAQLSKEDFAALEAQESESSTAPTGSFAKASQDELKRRKIVKAASPPSSTASKPSGGGGMKTNPFATVSLTKTSGGAPKVSFAAAAPAAAAPKVSFAPTVTPAPTMKTGHVLKRTPAPESFKQAHSSSMNSSTASFVGIPTPAKSSSSNDGRMKELAMVFTSHVATLPIQGGEWTSVMCQYKAYYEGLMSSNDGASSASVRGGTPSVATLTPTSTTTTPPPPVAAATSTSTATTPTTDTKTTPSNDGKDSKKPYFQVEPAKHFLLRPDGWTSTNAGKLSLESDDNGKRIVIRNDAGNVNLNCTLPKEIKIVSQKNSKGIVKRFIEFITQPEGEDQPLPIRLQTKNEHLDTLYEKIRALGEE